MIHSYRRSKLIDSTEGDLKKLVVEMDNTPVEKNHSNEELCELIQNGEIQAQEILCEMNRGLVNRIAGKYEKELNGVISKEDLEQAGMLGMLAAAERYDPSRGTHFSTYATWWIR